MKKYIIKNCPRIGWSKKLFKKCKADCTNHKPSDCSELSGCILKSVVEKCKKEISDAGRLLKSNSYANGIYDMANWILDFFEVEEVDNVENNEH